MQNKLNGGYVVILTLLVAALVGMYFLFKPNSPKVNTDSQNQTEESSTNKNEGDKVEENSQSSVTPTEPNDKKEITNNNQKIMQAILHTNKGNITIEFNTSTPKTVENFKKLAKEGFYDGTKFHRVIKGFMSQGGDPFSKDDSKSAMWGTGGPGYKFEDEITTNNKNDKYTISMANAGPNTNGSQFFINAANNNFLDAKHTVFGKVVAGADVADAINNVATGPGDRPLEPVVITNITLK